MPIGQLIFNPTPDSQLLQVHIHTITLLLEPGCCPVYGGVLLNSQLPVHPIPATYASLGIRRLVLLFTVTTPSMSCASSYALSSIQDDPDAMSSGAAVHEHEPRRRRRPSSFASNRRKSVVNQIMDGEEALLLRVYLFNL
jgi:hypothetical protein